ncbi:MAG: 2-oxoacid:acceptor oxidoreductase family protein [Candidatus Eiseniibacteriota bacterium]|nr:MAG: 2-oxoacid:acceptor oxidoreductase family protein [Candidatus Eisenbacteria bacterium]
MKEVLAIRWHGRGGQGAKMASFLLAECALEEGKWSQGFPDYGPERSGAPVRGFNRISDHRIDIHSPITDPDIVIVLDDTLIGKVDVCGGLKENGICIVNTQCDPATMRSRLKLNGRRLFTVDATTIALDEIGRPIPNTAMFGALAKASGVLKLETIVREIQKRFKKKFGVEVAEQNVKAVRRAYSEVKGE